LASKYFANDKAVSIMLMQIWIFIRQEWMKSILTVNVNDKSVKGNIKLNVFDLSGKM
jgi:hypothetical protein